jgi:hypothetical protein
MTTALTVAVVFAAFFDDEPRPALPIAIPIRSAIKIDPPISTLRYVLRFFSYGGSGPP